MAIIKKKSNVGKHVEKKEPSYTADGNGNWCSCYGKQYEGFSKLKIEQPYEPAIPLLGIHPKRKKRKY